MTHNTRFTTRFLNLKPHPHNPKQIPPPQPPKNSHPNSFITTLSIANTPELLPLLLLLLLSLSTLPPKVQGQFSPCPANATSCCQCVTTPGCSWYFGPLGDNSDNSGGNDLPRCRPLAVMAEMPASYSLNHLTPPGLVNTVTVLGRWNRPINHQRRRLIRPQQARTVVGLGMRSHLPFQVSTKSLHTYYIISLPRNPDIRGSILGAVRGRMTQL